MVNHLQTSHYHLGLVCSWCIVYFTTSANTMCQHSQLYKLALVNDDNNNREEESGDDDKSRECNDEFTFSRE